MEMIAIAVLGEDFLLHQPFYESFHRIGTSFIAFPGINHAECVHQFRVVGRGNMAAKVFS